MMIHAKLLLRRLACVPWLLAIGLALVELTATPVAALELTATPNVIREDAGETTILLEASLDYVPTANTEVLFTIADSPSGDSDFDFDTEVATRDVDYRAQVVPLTISAGQTVGMTTLNVTPRDNSEESLAKIFTVTASVGGTRASTGIKIADDETPTTEIWLALNPNEVYEGAGETEVIVTGTLNGRAFDADTTVRVAIDETVEDAAIRDLDYQIALGRLTIPAGSTSSSTTISVTALEGGDKKIGLTAVANDVDVVVGTVPITLKAGPPPPEVVSPDTNAEDASFVLSASPSTVSEAMEEATITVTATLNGGALTSDVTVNLSIDPASTAEENEDYEWDIDDPLVIRAGSTSGSTEISLEMEDDGETEGSETIILNGSDGGGSTVSSVEITLTDQTEPDPTKPVFTTVVPDQEYTVGETITPLVLPAAEGGTAPLVYYVSVLPAGLSFDPATRTLSGTPTQATTDALVVYAVVDSDNAPAGLNFFITVNDEKESTSITLSASPQTISEADGETTVTVTATLDGKALSDNTTVTLVINSTSTADRDVDYRVAGITPWIEIPAGSTVGSTELKIRPNSDNAAEGNETIKLTGTIDGLMADEVEITLTDQATTSITLSASPQTISEEDGETTVTVTITLDGKALSDNTTVTLVINSTSTADRDVDYSVEGFSPWIEIPAGSTTGSMQFKIRPTSDNAAEGNETIKLTGTIDGLMADEVEITLTDQATTSSDPNASITLSASPSTVSEEMEDATLTVTATLNDGALSSDVTVDLSIDPASTAEEDEDYEWDIDDPLVIRAGSTSGSTKVFLELEDDDKDEDRETIRLNGSAGRGLTVGWVEITLTDQTTEPPKPDDSFPAFAADAVIADQTYTINTAITPLVLPAATGGTGDLTYVVASLPAGLSFDPALRMLSGTPTAATDGAHEVLYTVIDGDGKSAALRFNITVNKKLTFDLSDLFGSGKIVPMAAPDWVTIREFVVGEYMDGLVLPESTGGTAPLTYSVSPALPAGLTFDPATRTIAGTPQAASVTVYTYTVTDANGASASLALQVLPAAFALADNFPNPFNPATTIQYALPTATDMELTVYNVVGQPVRTLVAGHQSAGRYAVEWDATDASGHSVSAGLYFYRLQAGGEFAEVKKMLLLK